MPRLYCERCDPGLFGEPFNAISNVSFLLAAAAAWSLGRRERALSPGLWVLIALAVSVGVGSGLWHTFATDWAMWLDIIPILLFQCCFLWQYSRRVIAMPAGAAAALLAGFIGVGLAAGQFPEALIGSLVYAPAFALSLALGAYHYRERKRERFLLLAGAGVFLLALAFRTIDLAVCPYFPRGTHFLWHILTAVVCYIAMRVLIHNRPGPTPGEEASTGDPP